jgi:hypothetical protein
MFLFANNASTRLVSPIAAVDTVLEVVAGEGERFPEPGYDEMFAITLKHPETGELEIVYCTERLYGDTFTVLRAQENTVAIAFPENTAVVHNMTAGVLDYLRDL